MGLFSDFFQFMVFLVVVSLYFLCLFHYKYLGEKADLMGQFFMLCQSILASFVLFSLSSPYSPHQREGCTRFGVGHE